MMNCNKENLKGVIFGQAVGDALGLGTEFMSRKEVLRNYPGGFARYEQIVQDSHRSRWKPGEWTDDTDMTLCIAHAMMETGKCGWKPLPGILRNGSGKIRVA